MRVFLRKVFNLSDIRYPWVLLISMLLFVFSLYNNKINPDISTIVEWATYGTAIGGAFVWSILNYIDHLKISAIYRKNDNIEIYVESLAMNREEKEDLKEYLNDFVRDLEEGGMKREEAIKTAIGQFQVQEFLSLSKNKGIFELPTHYYLLGYVLIFVVIMIIIKVLTSTIFEDLFLFHAINFTLSLYTISFLGLLILYKLIDLIIEKKMTH